MECACSASAEMARSPLCTVLWCPLIHWARVLPVSLSCILLGAVSTGDVIDYTCMVSLVEGLGPYRA